MIEIIGASKTPNGAASWAAEGGQETGSEPTGDGGLLLTLNGKTGWREVEIGRGSSPVSCPVARKNAGVSSERLTDKHVARLVQKTALAAGIRGDLPEGERRLAFSGHSLRAGLASPEMTRRYQRRRDRFKINLTKAAGL